MMLKNKINEPNLFQMYLPNILNLSHPLCKLARVIDWEDLNERFKPLYSEDLGRPAKALRLMVGLHYLKYMKSLSDEVLVEQWIENPYWQHFCGEEYFQTDFPIHPTSMTKWRNRLQESDLKELLESTIKSGLKTKTIKKSSIKKVNVDTTVQEKNITFPTDVKLYYKLIQHLVRKAKSHEIQLKQTYERSGKTLLRRHGGYVHAKQMKRALRVQNKLKTFLGRLHRDLLRKATPELLLDKDFMQLNQFVDRALKQTRKSKNKLYSVHEPHVECIAKGKSHKRYEFGNKVGFASTSKEGFILSASSFHGNPYDGHTLQKTLNQAEENTKAIGSLEDVYVDLGYRKHDYTGNAIINIVGRSRKKLTRAQRKWYNRRSVIEADIGHLKGEHRLDRNYLKGKNGDLLNVVFSSCGYNLRMIYRRIASIFFVLLKLIRKMLDFPEIVVENVKLELNLTQYENLMSDKFRVNCISGTKMGFFRIDYLKDYFFSS